MLKRLKRSPNAWVGGIIVLTLIVVALLAPVIGPEGFDDQDLLRRLKPPSSEHLLGTDSFGRDMMTRLVWGARISLQVGMISVFIGGTVGITMGLIAGYYQGKTDRIIMGVVDVLLAFPGILLAIAIVAALGPGLYNVMIAVGIGRIPRFARLVRGQVLSVREREFVEAAHALGSSDFRIIMRHLLPNVFSPILILASLDIAAAILSASGLSFLGLGAQPPLPDWGGMITSGREYIRTAWWLSTFPGVAIILTVLGFNLLGDGLRDALDPRLKT